VLGPPNANSLDPTFGKQLGDVAARLNAGTKHTKMPDIAPGKSANGNHRYSGSANLRDVPAIHDGEQSPGDWVEKRNHCQVCW
jgi:hypothetical protein